MRGTRLPTAPPRRLPLRPMLLHRGARRGAVVWPQPPAEPRAGSVGPGGSGSPTAGRAGLPRPPSPRETERGTCARPQIPGC